MKTAPIPPRVEPGSVKIHATTRIHVYDIHRIGLGAIAILDGYPDSILEIANPNTGVIKTYRKVRSVQRIYIPTHTNPNALQRIVFMEEITEPEPPEPAVVVQPEPQAASLEWSNERPTVPGSWLMERFDGVRREVGIAVDLFGDCLYLLEKGSGKGYRPLASSVFDGCRWAKIPNPPPTPESDPLKKRVDALLALARSKGDKTETVDAADLLLLRGISSASFDLIAARDSEEFREACGGMAELELTHQAAVAAWDQWHRDGEG